MDRLTPIITKTRAALIAGVRMDDGSPLDPEAVARLEAGLANDLDTHFRSQNAQAEAHAMGRISTEEAQVIYLALGEVPVEDGWAEGTDLATKVVVTEFLVGLVGAQIARRR